MRAPSDQVHGSPSFHSKIEKQADGSFLATNTSMPDVVSQSAATETEAIAKINRATEEWIGKGCIAGKRQG